MSKKLILFPFFLLVFAGGVLAIAFFWWSKNTKPASNDKALESFVIKKGSSAEEIGEKLYKEGLIRNSLAFKVYVQLTGKAKNIPAGEYRLARNLSLYDIASELTKGPYEIWVTIPEGLRREEISERFIKSFELKDSEADNFREEFFNQTRDKEGFLFPDTYLFPKTATASAAVGKMFETFGKKTEGLLLDKDTITLASLIERETRTEAERPLVAGIILKRLEKGWPLQVDATLQYAVANSKLKTQNSKLTDWWAPLTKDDLEINSAYNTYKFRGLPPTPIANPGLASLKAAVNPQDSPYWFYLHDSERKIHYAKTIEEHNQNVRKYLGK